MSAGYIVSPAALDDIDDLTELMRTTQPGADFNLRFIEELYDAFDFLT